MSKPATAIVISTGTEITEGLYPDTNAQQISRKLKQMGIRTLLHHAIPDDANLFREIVRSSFPKADLLICTGGIGPTEDDLNRELIAELWDQKLVRIPDAESMIHDRFRKRNRKLLTGNLKQADVPEASTPLLNHWGTACGFFIPPSEKLPGIIALPGVPREWSAMFGKYFPAICRQTFPDLPVYYTTTIHVVLVPESELNLRLKPFFAKWKDVTIALLAKLGRVRIRVTSSADSEAEARKKVQQAVDEILPALPEANIFSVGEEDIQLEEKVVSLYREKNMSFSMAESCTGGGMAKRITNIAGSSNVIGRSYVTYSDQAKIQMLGVSENTVIEHGVVSGPCVEEMAAGALKDSRADVAISVSGIAGPDGGSDEKPVGTVWFGIADKEGNRQSIHKSFGGTRSDIRAWSENQGLDLLRRWILKLPLE